MIMDFKPKTIAPVQDRAAEEELISVTSTMTDEEIQLLIIVNGLVADRPDRREMALNWTGKMKDLPAALAQI